MQLNLAPRVIERPMGEATPPTKCCAARQRRGGVGFGSRAVNKVHGFSTDRSIASRYVRFMSCRILQGKSLKMVGAIGIEPMSAKGMIALVFSPIYLTLTLLSSDQYVAKRPTGTPKQDRRGKGYPPR